MPYSYAHYTEAFLCLNDDNLAAFKVKCDRPSFYINYKFDSTSYSLLAFATQSGAFNCLEYLLTYPDINVNITTDTGKSPLHILENQLTYPMPPENIAKLFKCLELLLKHPQIRINQPTWDGHTPLHLAICDLQKTLYSFDVNCALFRFFKILMAQSLIDINQPNHLGDTPLHSAILFNNDDAISALLRHPSILINQFSLNASHQYRKSNYHYEHATPLHLAISSSSKNAVPLLLSHPDCNPYLTNLFGQTPLHLCAFLRDTLNLQYLLATITTGLLEFSPFFLQMVMTTILCNQHSSTRLPSSLLFLIFANWRIPPIHQRDKNGQTPLQYMLAAPVDTPFIRYHPSFTQTLTENCVALLA